MSNANKFADLVDLVASPRTVTPRERAHAAAAAVQTSLFGRLRKARGSAVAGRLAWMLVRLAQPDHVDSGAACEALRGFTDADVRLFLEVAKAAAVTAKREGAAEVAAAVVEALAAEVERRG